MRKKIHLLLIIVTIHLPAYNQVIKGMILDKFTNSPISFATVYINGTFIGTNSNQSGQFILDVTNYSSMPLSISALGYFSLTMSTYSTDTELKIYLSPKVFELKEIVVSAKADTKARNANMKLFKTQFLGQTLNALKCTIINEKDITLIYNKGNETLRAISSKPILIENKALGYTISYFLDDFEYCKSDNHLILTGNYIFKKGLSKSKIQNQIFERRRKTAYLGSRMHFFRVLWANDLDQSGFEVKNSANEKLNYDRLVIQTNIRDSIDNSKYLKNLNFLYITYFSKWGGSKVVFLKDSVYIDNHGYFDPFAISWGGEMSKQRIADLLPFEYIMKN